MSRDDAAAYSMMLRRVAPDVVRARRAVMRGGDTEAVHELRKALRRLRTLLALLARVAPSGAVIDLKSAAGDMAKALGPVRNWDVFMAESLPAARRAGLDLVAVGTLRAAAAALRATALAEAKAALRMPRQQTFALRLATAVGDVPAADSVDTVERTVAWLHRRILKRGRGFRRLDADGRHRVRLAGKALVDFAALVTPLGLVQGRSLKRLVRLTSEIGAERDRQTATQLAVAIAGPATAAKFSRALARAAGTGGVQGHWTAFRSARPPRISAKATAVYTAAALAEERSEEGSND